MLALAGLLAFGGERRVEAVACTLDTPPAATLLLPYFEIDLSDVSGLTTLFSIGNASAEAALVNVTLWTDLGVPTLAFPVYLTGFDVETVNLRDVFAGNLPRTASVGQDPGDTTSPRGPASFDANYASCAGQLPPPPFPPGFVEQLRRAHRGLDSTLTASPLPVCAGAALGDNRARGFVTVDLVNTCSTTIVFPSDLGYFGAGGRARSANILWGDVFYVDSHENFARGDQLVRIEAFPGRFAPGDITFYGRFHHGGAGPYTAIDDREPLAFTWATRFLQGGTFDGGTHLVVWRDPAQASQWVPCGTVQPWQVDDSIVAFDEQENPQADFGCPFLCPPPPVNPNFPRMAQRIAIADVGIPNAFGDGRTPIDFQFGWAGLSFINRTDNFRPAQAWVGTEMSAQGRFSLSTVATPLDSACGTARPLPPEF